MSEIHTAMVTNTWLPDNPAQVVEHDDATRQPKPGGLVLAATITAVTASYVLVSYDDAGTHGLPERDQFWRDSGWRAWDGEFRWRLMQKDPEAGKTTPEGGRRTTSND